MGEVQVKKQENKSFLGKPGSFGRSSKSVGERVSASNSKIKMNNLYLGQRLFHALCLVFAILPLSNFFRLSVVP